MSFFLDYHGKPDRNILKKAFSVFLQDPAYALKQIFPTAFRSFNYTFSPYTRGRSFTLNRVFLVLTYRCDSRCTMCYLWSDTGFVRDMNHETLHDELSVNELCKVIDDVSPYQPSIVLFGGEPLLYKSWAEIAGYVKQKKLRLCMTTDGGLLEKHAESVVDTLDSLQVSLDAPEPQLHDDIRRYKGLFNKVLAGIEAVDRIKKEKNKKTPLVDIGFTIFHKNYRKLSDMAKYVLSLPYDINALNFQYLEYATADAFEIHRKFLQEKGKPSLNYWKGCLFDPDTLDVEYLAQEIHRIKQNSNGTKPMMLFNPEFGPELVRRHYSGEKFNPPARCSMPWLEAHVLPDGSVWICPDYRVGNVRKNSFKEIWNNGNAREIRNFLNAGNRFAVCNNCMGNYLYHREEK